VNSLLLAPELFLGEGGIARILRLYLKGLCEISGEGDRVRFLTLNDRAVGTSELRNYSDSHLVEWGAFNRRKVPFGIAALRVAMRSDRIICGHIGQLPIAWAAARIRPRLQYYVVAHGIEVWRPFTRLERLALGRARRILCVSEYTRRQVLSFSRLPLERTAVLFNALDPGLDPASATDPGENPPIILTVSRLSIADNYKGIGHLISAMPAVLARIPDARLRIVGRGDDLPSLQSLARKLKLESSVEFAGYRSDSELSNDLNGCRLFALPSQKEGFGLVYLEAMAHGRPCLGARAGGVPEVITEDTGVLADYGDIPGIAAGIVSGLQRNWALEPLLERARMFSYPTFRERLAALLSE
jgi:glycosyltransferase involved in cell wall biosynthesis